MTENKLNFNNLVFEITRKCNLKCEHCVKGESQNITITKDIIDKVLESVESCEEIALTGGEPFLEIDIIEYLVDKIIEKDIEVFAFSCVTNGTILDERIVDIYKKINTHCKSKSKAKIEKNQKILEIILGKNIKNDVGERACISISSDGFHKNTKYEEALSFYKNKLRNAEILVEYHQEKDIKDKEVAWTYDGRMIKNYEKLGKPPCVCNSSRHRIEYEDDGVTIKCPIEIYANGNVGISSMESFNNGDKNSIGNILNESLKHIIEKNIKNEPFSCAECYMQLDYKRGMLGVGVTEPLSTVEKLASKYLYNFMEKDRNMRLEMHKLFPESTIEEISEGVIMYMNYISNGKYIESLREIYPEYSHTNQEEKEVYKIINSYLKVKKVNNILNKIFEYSDIKGSETSGKKERN